MQEQLPPLLRSPSVLHAFLSFRFSELSLLSASRHLPLPALYIAVKFALGQLLPRSHAPKSRESFTECQSALSLSVRASDLAEGEMGVTKAMTVCWLLREPSFIADAWLVLDLPSARESPEPHLG